MSISGQVRTSGLVVVKLFDENKKLKAIRRSKNIVTDAGDQLYALLSGGSSAQVPPTMMMIGAMSGTPAKNGTYSTLTGYYNQSGGGDNGIRAIDSGFPTFVSKGAGLGWRTTWRCTWNATYLVQNNATFNSFNGAMLCNVSPVPSNVGGTVPTAAQTVAVDSFTALSKGQQDTLVISWYQDFLGGT